MPYNNPIYPNAIWDGLTKNPNRVDLNSNVDPNSDDWERIAAEVIAMQQNAGGGGLSFTGGFTDRTTGSAGSTTVGSNRNYLTADATANRWMTFGIDPTQQAANDNIYWSDPDTTSFEGYDATKGLFGGTQLPPGCDQLFNFTSTELSADGTLGDGSPYLGATGSLDFSGLKLGDKFEGRFDFNIEVQIANTTLESGLLFFTRDASDVVTFKFALTSSPTTFGTGTVGNTYLMRPTISAYFASNEDINAVALPAIRSNNPVGIQPLTYLASVQR